MSKGKKVLTLGIWVSGQLKHGPGAEYWGNDEALMLVDRHVLHGTDFMWTRCNFFAVLHAALLAHERVTSGRSLIDQYHFKASRQRVSSPRNDYDATVIVVFSREVATASFLPMLRSFLQTGLHG